MYYTSYDQLPLMLNAEDVQAVMHISRAAAYQLMHKEGFPTIQMGRRIVVHHSLHVLCVKHEGQLIITRIVHSVSPF